MSLWLPARSTGSGRTGPIVLRGPSGTGRLRRTGSWGRGLGRGRATRPDCAGSSAFRRGERDVPGRVGAGVIEGATDWQGGRDRRGRTSGRRRRPSSRRPALRAAPGGPTPRLTGAAEPLAGGPPAGLPSLRFPRARPRRSCATPCGTHCGGASASSNPAIGRIRGRRGGAPVQGATRRGLQGDSMLPDHEGSPKGSRPGRLRSAVEPNRRGGATGTSCQAPPRRRRWHSSSASRARRGGRRNRPPGRSGPSRRGFDDPDRVRFPGLDVETGGFRHRGTTPPETRRADRGSTGRAGDRAASLPTLDEQVGAAGQPAVAGPRHGAGGQGDGGELDRPVHGRDTG